MQSEICQISYCLKSHYFKKDYITSALYFISLSCAGNLLFYVPGEKEMCKCLFHVSLKRNASKMFVVTCNSYVFC
jgi:hypothetical protein